MHGLNKKGIIFTAASSMLLVVLVIFAVTIYQVQEEGEQKIISNSLASQMINAEDSIQQAMKKIYETNTNISANMNIISPTLEYIEINTTLLEQGPPSQNIIDDINLLEERISSEMIWSSFNGTAIQNNLLLERGSGIAIQKTAKNTVLGTNEKLILYYNKSGKNTGTFYGIDISIITTEKVFSINQYSSAPNNGDVNDKYLNITVNDINYPVEYINPEFYEDNKNIQFSVPLSGVYTWIVNNSYNNESYLNITLDSEKVEINVINGTFDVNTHIAQSPADMENKFYFEPKAIRINIPAYGASKSSRIMFG